MESWSPLDLELEDGAQGNRSFKPPLCLGFDMGHFDLLTLAGHGSLSHLDLRCFLAHDHRCHGPLHLPGLNLYMLKIAASHGQLQKL